MFSNKRISKLLARGFTLIELMVVIALVGLLMAIAAPSMREMIEMRRLVGIHAQFMTDLQWARSEAISRRAFAFVDFMNTGLGTPYVCYTIFTSSDQTIRCDCTTGTCNPGAVPLRRVVFEPAQGVLISNLSSAGIAFDPATGGLNKAAVDLDPEPLNQFVADTALDTTRRIRTFVGGSGRPTACAPTGTKVNLPRC